MELRIIRDDRDTDIYDVETIATGKKFCWRLFSIRWNFLPDTFGERVFESTKNLKPGESITVRLTTEEVSE